MYSLAHDYNLMLKITFKPFYTLYVLIHGLETARESISMTYSTINMYSLAHVYNLMLKITFKPFYTLYVLMTKNKENARETISMTYLTILQHV